MIEMACVELKIYYCHGEEFAQSRFIDHNLDQTSSI